MTQPSFKILNPPFFNIVFTSPAGTLLLKSILFICTVFLLNSAGAQNLIISASGQTGTSGTNWSTSGTNPVTIAVTGAAGINTSVIEGYLNAGTSVVVNNGNTAATGINSNISKTTGNSASLTFKDLGCIKVADNVSISSTSNALDIILWVDSDNNQGGGSDDFIYCGAGSTFSSNGGKIVMAGGPDNGTNGGVSGDGIPDGFAWNGSNSTTFGADQVGGLTLGPRGGTGAVVSLMSNNGEIILRGSTSNNNGYPGITSQGNLKIVSGTGKITMFGKSITGHGMELTFGAAPSIVISSASTSTPAIDLKGTTTATNFCGFWISNNAAGNVLIESTAATNGGVTIEGTASSNNALFLGTNGSSILSQILSQAGTITLKGKGPANKSLILYGELYIGNRKDANAVQGVIPSVTASTANILLQGDDQYQFGTTAGKNTNINSTGSLTMEAYSNGYSGTISWAGNAAIGSAFSSITLGESAENYSFFVNNSLTAAGNITAYTSDFILANGVGLASSVAGTININAKGSFNTSGTTRRTISTVNGNINIFADSDASGNGQLDIDYTTFNPGSGNTTLRTETMSWVTANNVDRPYFNGTGTVTIEPSDASFQDVQTFWFFFDQDGDGMAGLTIGKSTNTGLIVHQFVPLTVAGPIALYGGTVTLSANLTSSATGDIFIKSNNIVNAGASIAGGASILKTAGTGTLTMQSRDRLNSGTITASGTGVLNVVLWSDYNNDNNGGVAVSAITTNGGHLWVGGSSSNGGSYTWNGLTVGNGPSVGSVNNNFNAIDFTGPVSTNGGDVLVWGGNGFSSGIFGIGVYPGAAINSGSGDITLIGDNISNSPSNDLTITSTGVLRLVPDGGSYPSAINWSGTITSGNFNGTNTFDALIINNFANLGGLSLGYFNEQLSSGTPVLQGNSSNVTINTPITIAGPITVATTTLSLNEMVDIGNNNFRFIGNTIVPAANKFIKTNGVGKMITDISNNASKLFPVGINFYNPVTITNHTGAVDTFYATASTNVYVNGSTSGTTAWWSPRIDLTWNIGNTAATTGSGNVDLAFGWNAANVNGSLTSLSLLHYNGSFWEKLSDAPSFDLSARTLTYTDYTGTFSPFSIAESTVILPITWISFTGKKVQNTVALKWITAAEQNNNYFDVERSVDGVAFTSIGRVAAIQQTQAQQNEYQYIDNRPLGGRSYYRLKQVDFDGKNSYSAIVNLNIAGEQGYNMIAMPGAKQLELSVPSSVVAKADLLIYDANGRQVMSQQLRPGRNIITTRFLMADGVYFIKIVQGKSLLYSNRFVN